MVDSLIISMIDNAIRNDLSIHTNWIGDPKTSTFGIEIILSYKGSPISISTIDFIGKTFD